MRKGRLTIKIPDPSAFWAVALLGIFKRLGVQVSLRA